MTENVILLVEDCTEDASLVMRAFKKWGITNTIHVAADGEQAVEAASTLRPSIVILDVHLPGITGFDAARQILKTSPDLLILILSIHDDPRYADAARDCGARGFLNKCNADEFLIPAISALLRGELYFPQLATDEP